MFTGIITHLGEVKKVKEEGDNKLLTISSPLAKSLSESSSVAVSGACLTVLQPTNQHWTPLEAGRPRAAVAPPFAGRLLTGWTVHLMAETLNKTNLGQLTTGNHVNLELPLTANQPIDGHFVLGHIDGQVTVTSIKTAGQDKIFTFKPPTALLPYLIPKGSVALDGVSLTIVDITDQKFTVSMMPYTLEHTILGQVTEGYQANIEVDILGKYVKRLAKYANVARTNGENYL